MRTGVYQISFSVSIHHFSGKWCICGLYSLKYAPKAAFIHAFRGEKAEMVYITYFLPVIYTGARLSGLTGRAGDAEPADRGRGIRIVPVFAIGACPAAVLQRHVELAGRVWHPDGVYDLKSNDRCMTY